MCCIRVCIFAAFLLWVHGLGIPAGRSYGGMIDDQVLQRNEEEWN